MADYKCPYSDRQYFTVRRVGIFIICCGPLNYRSKFVQHAANLNECAAEEVDLLVLRNSDRPNWITFNLVDPYLTAGVEQILATLLSRSKLFTVEVEAY